MAFVDNTIEVEADVRDVYDVWTAYEDYPEFMVAVERVDLVPDSDMHWVAVMHEDLIEWDSEVVEHVAEERVSWRAVDGRETGQVTFDKIADGRTRVHYQLEYDPSVWACSPEDLDRWMRERLESDLEAFKEVMEASE